MATETTASAPLASGGGGAQTEEPYIDLRKAQALLDKYKETLTKSRQTASSSLSTDAAASTVLLEKPTLAPKPSLTPERAEATSTQSSSPAAPAAAAAAAAELERPSAETAGDDDDAPVTGTAAAAAAEGRSEKGEEADDEATTPTDETAKTSVDVQPTVPSTSDETLTNTIPTTSEPLYAVVNKRASTFQPPTDIDNDDVTSASGVVPPSADEPVADYATMNDASTSWSGVEPTYAEIDVQTPTEDAAVAAAVDDGKSAEPLYAEVERRVGGSPDGAESAVLREKTSEVGNREDHQHQQQQKLERRTTQMNIHYDETAETHVYSNEEPVDKQATGANQTATHNGTSAVVTSPADRKSILVTSSGVTQPIRFTVRSFGSLPMCPEDMVATRSAPAVMEHINTLTSSNHQTSDDVGRSVVYLWPHKVDIGLELNGKNLDTIDLEHDTVLTSLRLRHIRLWGTGQRADSREFAYVSRDTTSGLFMCHVFRCCHGNKAEQITTALRDVCWKMHGLKQRTARR